jgi:hypothetical protein
MLKKMFIAWGAVFCLQAAQTDGMLTTTLEDLRDLAQAQTPFFCMTAAANTEWLDRRRDSEKIGVDRLSKVEPWCFSKEWRQEESDTVWNTVYTKRTIGSVYTEQNPFDYQSYEKFPRTCPSEPKGYVFSELIKDGFIARPDFFIFLDDQISFLNSTEESCTQSGISSVGLHCEFYIQQK